MISFYITQVLLKGRNRIHKGLVCSHDLVFNVRCGSVRIAKLAMGLYRNNGRNLLSVDLEP